MSNGTARVTTFVDVAPRDAFEVFTEEIDRWWGRGPRYRDARGAGVLAFEGNDPRALVERFDDGTFHVKGKVLAWEPHRRLVFEWRNSNFAPDEVTEVEVLFEERNGGTRVTLEHRGWEKIRRDHPVRHGDATDAFVGKIGRWWGELLTSFRMHATPENPV